MKITLGSSLRYPEFSVQDLSFTPEILGGMKEIEFGLLSYKGQTFFSLGEIYERLNGEEYRYIERELFNAAEKMHERSFFS